MMLTSYFNLGTIVILIIYCIIFRRILHKHEYKIDESDTSVTDYSIWVENIPTTKSE